MSRRQGLRREHDVMHVCRSEVGGGGDAEKIEWSRETRERGLESGCEEFGGRFGGDAKYDSGLATVVEELLHLVAGFAAWIEAAEGLLERVEAGD